MEVGGPGEGPTGGFNGGGGGGQGTFSPRGGGGGGSTDLRICSAGSCQGGLGASLASRLAVAGGGGGGAAGLLGTTGVSFGGTPAAGFQVLGDARLTAVTPAHASGTVDVTVTTPAGTSATAPSDRFAFEETGASLPEAPETGSSPAKPLASPPIRGFC